MSEKQTTHNYDFRTFSVFGHMYFWGRTDSTTDVLDENERMLFNIPFVAEERDVRMALFGYLERDLRDFAKGAKNETLAGSVSSTDERESWREDEQQAGRESREQGRAEEADTPRQEEKDS